MLSDQNVELVQRFIRLPMQQRRVFFERLQAKGMNLSQFPIPVVRHAFEAVPLSYAQERLWFLWRLDPLSPAYHIRTALSLDGELDGAALQASLDALVARHEGLRTRFVEDNGQVFAQVDAKAKISIEQQPWNGSDTELDAFVGQWARQPFELDQGQLLRGLLLRRSACEHVLVLVQHHIISDAASMQVMVQEWLSLYAAHLAGQVPALAALPIQYGDYAIWQRCWMEAGERERQLKYWRERLGMDPGPLQLPLDHPRPLRASHRGERVKVRLPAALGQGLQQLAREQGASVFMVLLASFQALLQRYSGQDQVRVGVPIANRHRQETQGLIGFFVNTQVLQAQLTPQMSFLDLLEQVRASVAEAQSHQDLPFEQLVEALQPQRSAGHSPLFQVSYNHQGRQGPSLALPGLSLTPLELTSETVKFDLTLETQEQAQGLSASLLYATDLFQRATIERLASDWAGLLHGLWANPKAALCELPLQPVQPPQRLEARQAAPQVHRLIEAQVDRDPEALALVAQGRRLSYGQLEQQANHWAQRLLVEGLQAEERVAVIASRSVALAVGVLAVLKAGGAYVPLDPQENPERLAFRLNDAGVRRALVEPGFDGPLPDGVGRLELREVERPSAKRPHVVVAAEQLAYVIYTSGTTGLPKGVGVSHGALGNYVQGVSARLPLAGMASLAMVSTPAADLGHTVFFGALCAGKALHLVAAETAVDALRFAEYLDREQIDGLKIVPSHLESLVNAQGQQPVLPRRCVILGGESASEALLGTLARVAPRLTVINHYGPTETTVGVLTAELAAGQPVLLGRALAGSHVQVASPWLLAMPAGAQGELYIGGSGLARGYLNQPGLTAERFVPDPFATEAGARMYRSGDLALCQADGSLRYLGRADQQIKIRGFRVEPEEVAARLHQSGQVRDLCVVAWPSPSGPRLVAYGVPVDNGLLDDPFRAQALSEQLRQGLAGQLPDYMQPAALVWLAQLPLTSNGKLDRQALPAPDLQGTHKAYRAPQGPLEQQVAQVWAEVLKVERVGLDDNFFELGGHSLLAISVIARLRQQLGLDLGLHSLFDTPDLAAFVAAAGQQVVTAGRIAPRPAGQRRVPLSYAQQRQWFIWQMDRDSSAYNLPMAFQVSGELDLVALQRAFDSLAERHEVLRTRFEQADEALLQVIEEPAPVALEVEDCTGASEARIRQRVEHELHRPFDLERGPLLRVRVLHCGAERHVLTLTLHHIVADGWSIPLLVGELLQAYSAQRNGQPLALPAMPIQYADYALWQREPEQTEEYRRQLVYWRERLGGEQPALELPLDHPRPAVRDAAGATFKLALGPERLAALQALARQEKVTMFMLLLASFNLLLHRYSGAGDIRVGIPTANRNRLETENLVGFFVNTQVIRTDLDGLDSVQGLLAQVRDSVVQAQSCQDLPFEQLVDAVRPERSLSLNPLFQVMFNHQSGVAEQASEHLRAAGLQLRSLDWDNCNTHFDLTLNTVEDAAGLRASFTYATSLFEAATIERVAGHWLALLDALLAHPYARLCTLELEPTRAAGALASRLTVPALVHELIARQAELQPDATALIACDRRLTFAELEVEANQLAWRLIEAGVGPETRVAVALPRHSLSLVAYLAVLKAGGAYVPLDLNYPPQRLAYMLADSRASLVLSQTGLLDSGALPVLCLDQPHGGALRSDAPVVELSVHNLAYVIYTSGSTGQPKGVAVNHGPAAMHCLATGQVYEMRATDCELHFLSFAFDGAHERWLTALIHGASLLLRDDEVWSPERLCEEMQRHAVSVVALPPVYLMALAEQVERAGNRPALRVCCYGGDAMPKAGFDKVQRVLAPQIMINGYGPTEAVVTPLIWKTGADDRCDATYAPIGECVGERSAMLLDDYLAPKPLNCAGELYLGGHGLARGYLDRPGLTAERFVPDPYGEPGARMYRSGDLVREHDGNLEYLGRADNQVKVRGFRIELGEVEARLNRLEGVADAVASVQEGASGKQLVAHVIAADAGVLDSEARQSELREALRAALGAELPDYMVPAFVVFLGSWPLTANGKLDRKALPKADASLGQQAHEAPANAHEQMLAQIWAAVLGLPRVGVQDNFFELGGDSIVTIQVVSRARQAGLHFSARDLFQHQTVRALARVAQLSEQNLAVGTEVPEGAVELLPIQQLFFARPMSQRQHWNQSIVLEPAQRVESEPLRQALAALLAHHDALRCRFLEGVDGWHACLGDTAEDNPLLWCRDFADEAQWLELCEQAQRSLDIEQGPLLRALLGQGADGGQRLLLVIHHLVVDGVSWRILLEDLQNTYTRLCQGQAPALPARTSSVQAWALHLQDYARGRASSQLEFWHAQLQDVDAALPMARTGASGLNQDACKLGVALDAETTRRLLQQAPAAYRTRINDLLLTALVRAFAQELGLPALPVLLEGHGREDLGGNLDLTRTVGWFTSVYPLRLSAGPDLAESIKQVKEQLRSLPDNGLGFGALRYLGSDEARERLAGPLPRVTFNYLGQFDSSLDASDNLFSASAHARGADQSQQAGLSNWLTLNGQVFKGVLSFGWSFSRHQFAPEAIGRLADAFIDQLQQIVQHCCQVEHQGLTPSDFPALQLTQAQLDQLPVAARDIEDIYELAPMQHGMLFHSLYEQQRAQYVNQLRMDVSGLDLQRFVDSWQAALDGHAILRTGFIWQNDLAEPLQVVCKPLPLPLQVLDWQGREDLPGALEALALDQRAQGFDLQRPPLLRLTLVATAPGRHHLIYTVHHILMDGWSNSQLLGEVLQRYSGKALTAGAGRYRDYIDWLKRQDPQASEGFWKAQLAPLAEPTLLAQLQPPLLEAAEGYGDAFELLDEARCTRLAQAARDMKVTFNSLLQGAWAVLLQRLSGQDCVAFGATVSGRPAELDGIEQQIGLFINTLPVISSPDPRQTGSDWLRQVQALNLALREQEHTRLADIQRWAGSNGMALFDTLLVFENYPVSQALQEKAPHGLAFDGLINEERTSYPLTLLVHQGQTLKIHASYERARFTPASIAGLLQQWVHLAESLALLPQRPLGQLGVLPAVQHQHVLADFNRTGHDYPVQQPLHAIIEAQVERTPDAIAVVFEGQRLSYRQLDERANHLAWQLIDAGVGTQTLVGVCAERSLELVVSLLAVLKAGAAYVPLDPDYPAERLAYMAEDSGIRVLLGQASVLQRLGAFDGVKCLQLEALQGRTPQRPAIAGLDGEGLMYLLYTSGSTGRPKGAGNWHGALINRIGWMQRAYALHSGDVVLQKTPFSFDVSVWEFFWPLMVGARLVLAAPGDHRDPARLIELIEREQVTTLHFVPSMLQVFLQEPQVERCTSVRRLFCSGEALLADTQAQVFDKLPDTGLYNLYGPTEAAIDVTHWTCREEGRDSVPIGQPIDNLACYILDDSLQPLPVGARGELYLSGIGLARGYHRRPGLTAERFPADPFNPGQRMYRTGDLARYRDDGVIEYLGRTDHQVKLRGLRIELGEIQARLLEHELVQDVCVQLLDASQLVAWLVLTEQRDDWKALLQVHLAAQLPEYMVPAYWLALERMPLSPNGKLDRKALPAPERQASAEHVGLCGSVETLLGEIWAQVLRVPQVGALDNFFELGGDSILSIQVVARARQAGLEINPRLVFQFPTVRQLAAQASEAQEQPVIEVPAVLHRLSDEQVARLPVSHAQLADLYPLSPMQQGMLFQCLNEQAGGVYVNQLSISVKGLDSERFGAALAEVCRRHSILRTGFIWQELNEPLQFVLDSVCTPLRVVDGREWTDQEQGVAELAAQERAQGIALDQPSLQRVLLVRTGEHQHQLIWTYHHILVDGWSLSQLIGEVLGLYAGRDLVAATPYRDYIAWLQRQDAGAGERFWREQLASLEEPCLLASTVPVQAGRQGHEALYSHLDAEPLSAFARSQHVTLNTLVQGAWLILLSRFSGQRSVAFGSTVAGRSPTLPGAERIMGLFINTLPVVRELHPEARVGDWLRELQDCNLGMRDHEYVALADIQRWAGQAGRALFDSIIVFENQPVDEALRQFSDASLEFGPSTGSGLTDFPMDLMVTVEQGCLSIEYMYLRRCFEDETVLAIRAAMESLLQRLCDSPDQRLGQLGLPVSALQPLAVEAAPAQWVHQRIEGLARQQPQALALSCAGQSLSYAELDRRSNALAHRLIAAGVGPEVRVAVALPRSAGLLVSLLAVLKAGGAYVPLDLNYPRERLAYLLEDCAAQLLITDSAARASLPVPPGLACLELGALASMPEVEQAPSVSLHADNLAYVIYTSGSTGLPKGVAVSHGPLARHCHAIGLRYEMSPVDCELHFMSFAFDGAHERWLTALTHGARLLVRDEQLWTPEQTLRALDQHQVTVAAFPPAYLQQLIEQARLDGAPASMRVYCFGGDALPQATYEQAREVLGAQYLINGYGPTETVVTPLLWRADARHRCTSAYAPIGEPVGPRRALVLDSDLNPLPPGVAGELYLGGEFLARGYLHRPGLSAERFVADPYGRGERLYRTGDLVREDADGTFHYLGRVDNQVKIRGLRIELGEIEARLLAQPGVREAAVIARELPGGKRLLAYVVGAPEWLADPSIGPGLREALKQALPEFMVPWQISVLAAMPLNPNGKLDRRALPDPQLAQATGCYVAPRTELQIALAEIWAKVLKVERVGLHDNFFELGGDSILSLQVVARSRPLKALGLTLKLRDLIQKPTIAELSGESAATAGANAVLALNGPAPGQPPLFCVHAGYGTVFDYEPLARSLDGQRQVLAIQSRMLLDPGWSDESLLAMAQDYVGYVRERQPQGPYWLAGWSLGATLAALMAAELELQGQQVAFLGLLDGFVPGAEPVARAEAQEQPRQLPAGLSTEDLALGLATGRHLRGLSAALAACAPVQARAHCWWVHGREAEAQALYQQLGQGPAASVWLDCGHYEVPHHRQVLDALLQLLDAPVTSLS
ncbi:non-ribosomal peptide synthetase [Pseudomonas putida]|uniref:non-ribosomal peptide synthetase n=1 Tax=Pseudomonas putida TaxID=303 RepID=UPI0007716F66|nr:non-ribosomal peptide synthetase [Pseudomonas putida]KWW14624.1 hypothetical protein AS889_11370 [Pseudomonas putida]MDQ2482460.1 non-ribosomal peptide synthetase [Pseudomonas putida]